MSSEGSSPPVRHRGLRIAAVVGLAVAVVVVGGGIATRAANSKHVQQLTDEQARPVVTVSLPTRGGNSYAIDLPGRLEAYSRAPIYARVSGYLKDWHVDIGSPVPVPNDLRNPLWIIAIGMAWFFGIVAAVIAAS